MSQQRIKFNREEYIDVNVGAGARMVTTQQQPQQKNEQAEMSMQSYFVTEKTHSPFSNTRFVAVYLCYPDLHKATRQELFRKSDHRFEQQLTMHPIFLNKTHAVQYCRFMGNNHSILKLFVPESAIVADEVTFSLKHGVVSSNNIHGYFPNFEQADDYCVNPWFDGNCSPNQGIATSKT